MSPKQHTDRQCQFENARGQRCHMLIDNHHPGNGTARPTLCAYAADLLGDINDFSTAGSVNLFLGNLVKQLARKRMARRDAIALAYISQLLLNSLPALERALAAEKEAAEEAAEEAEAARINARIRQQNRELAARRQQQATVSPPQQVTDNERPAS